MKSYPSLKAEAWFNISGRGKIAVIENENLPFPTRIGDIVDIDGTLYEIRGLEMTNPTNHRSIGFLVREYFQA